MGSAAPAPSNGAVAGRAGAELGLAAVVFGAVAVL